MIDGEESSEEEYSEDDMVGEAIEDANVSDVSDEDIEQHLSTMTKWQNLSGKQKEKIKKELAGKELEQITDPDMKLFKIALAGNASERMSKIMHPSNMKDTGTSKGVKISVDEFRKRIVQRPKELLKQNAKIKKTGSTTGNILYNTSLPSYQGLFVDESTGKFKIVKTCPGAMACTAWCYASKGNFLVQSGPSMAAARTVNYLMNDPEGFEADMIRDINKAVVKNKGLKVIVRWHDSGDFISPKYLLMAYNIAKATPMVEHYAYTKQIPLTREYASEKPTNFTLRYSIGGLWDEEVDKVRSTERHADAYPVPKEYHTRSRHEIKPGMLKDFKAKLAADKKLDPTTIITYDELLKKPLPKLKPGETEITPKWNVIVGKGNGDDAAYRKDVLGVYLLMH